MTLLLVLYSFFLIISLLFNYLNSIDYVNYFDDNVDVNAND